MKKIDTAAVREQARELYADNAREITACAVLLGILAEDTDFDDPSVPILADLAVRIYNEMPLIDEPRYTLHDYADAVTHANAPLDPAKLLALEPESFAMAMIWLATDKRETYEGRAHDQEPLGFNLAPDEPAT